MKRGTAHCTGRHAGLAYRTKDVLCVDTFQRAPLDMDWCRQLGPFFFDSSWRIPVPGRHAYACSVESIWQGTKLVDGADYPAMFAEPPVKRPPDGERHGSYRYQDSTFRYGDANLGLVAARFAIYLPAFLYALDREVPQSVIDHIETTLQRGRDVVFFDWDSNMDILRDDESFSHSAILAAYFNGALGRYLESFYDRVGSWPWPPAELHLTRYQDIHGAIA